MAVVVRTQQRLVLAFVIGTSTPPVHVHTTTVPQSVRHSTTVTEDSLSVFTAPRSSGHPPSFLVHDEGLPLPSKSHKDDTPLPYVREDIPPPRDGS